ncbi:MAG TPA: 3'-5' exonuclease, partial [Bryobacteraceae bacterium]|nr:3'-5' exonuclease [Bryobacteraceae bacterium]
QIRAQADRLLGSSLHDVDGNVEERKGTTSVFSGPPPEIRRCPDAAKEVEFVSGWLTARTNGDAIQPHEIGVFVRSAAQMDRAIDAVALAGLKSKVLDKNVEIAGGTVSIATMHLAKGLEFRAVAVMACDDEVIPLQERIENASDDSELEEIYTTERHLLYVACTRAREHLLISGAEPVSEFVDDLRE